MHCDAGAGVARKAALSIDTSCIKCNKTGRQQTETNMRDFIEILRGGLNWRCLIEAGVLSGFLVALAIWLPEISR